MLSAYIGNDFKVNIDIEKQQEEETEMNIIDPAPVKQFERNLAKKGYLPFNPGECYGKQITHNSHVFIQRINESSKVWTGYRLTYDYEDGTIKSEKTIIEGRSIINVIKRVESYVINYRDFIKRIN